jgi:peptidoglycan hydrolase-like protein with peptidoglycan-binding domain
VSNCLGKASRVGIAQSNKGSTVIRISRTTVALASVAVLAVGVIAAGIVLVAPGSRQPAAHTAHAAPLPPLRVVSISPAGGERDVDGVGNVTVTYNQPLPASAPLPVLSPAIAGSWRRSGDTAVFTPAIGFPARTRVTVTAVVAVTAAAKDSARGQGSSGASAAPTASFTTGSYSTLRLQEILAQLGYLPLSWTPARGVAVPAGNAAAQLAAAYAAPPGAFHWVHRGYPSSLYSFWSRGKPNMLDVGAITGFEADHGLTPDGLASRAVWSALLAAAAKGQRNAHGYSYAIASESVPETLTIWHNGRQVFSSLANTGISVRPTGLGTFPVYEKLPFQIMSGTNPDGSHYADPVYWVSYFEGGDAVHYFDRGSYGWPQSLGCVELPYGAAEAAYPYLPYGTLVTVEA